MILCNHFWVSSPQQFCANTFVWGVSADFQLAAPHGPNQEKSWKELRAGQLHILPPKPFHAGLRSAGTSPEFTGSYLPAPNTNTLPLWTPFWNAISLLVNYLEDFKTQKCSSHKMELWAWRRELCIREKCNQNKSQGFHPGELLLCLLFATSTLDNSSQRVPAFHYFPKCSVIMRHIWLIPLPLGQHKPAQVQALWTKKLLLSPIERDGK